MHRVDEGRCGEGLTGSRRAAGGAEAVLFVFVREPIEVVVEHGAEHPIVDARYAVHLDAHDAVVSEVCCTEARQQQVVTRRVPACRQVQQRVLCAQLVGADIFLCVRYKLKRVLERVVTDAPDVSGRTSLVSDVASGLQLDPELLHEHLRALPHLLLTVLVPVNNPVGSIEKGMEKIETGRPCGCMLQGQNHKFYIDYCSDKALQGRAQT